MIRLSDIQYRFRGASVDDRKALIERCRKVSYNSWGTEQVHICLEKYSWRIHDGDLRLPGNVVNDINLIVMGDLIIDGWYDDFDCEGFLAVFGAMRCQHLLSRSMMFVTEDLLIEGLNYQDYNDWCFECGGQVAARAFICYDKQCIFDRERAVFEGYWDFNDGFKENHRNPYEMLGLEVDDEGDLEKLITQHVKTAEARGCSPFTFPGPKAPAWREALHPATTPERLTELAASHAWDVAMRPQLAPKLQDTLGRHDDARLRWAIASAPGASESTLRRLATDAEPMVRAAVANHANCPEDLRVAFAGDPAPNVRAATVNAHGEAATVAVVLPRSPS